MSVLPLVFPDNMSCFSRGSYKVVVKMMVVAMMNDSDFLEVDNDYDTQEELARKRQLPVPPMPRKGGVIARSEDNVSGADHHHYHGQHGPDHDQRPGIPSKNDR